MARSTSACSANREADRPRCVLDACLGPRAREADFPRLGFPETTSLLFFEPENIVALRNSDANALRKACAFLRWHIVSDAALKASD
jgi:hypothetical protein